MSRWLHVSTALATPNFELVGKWEQEGSGSGGGYLAVVLEGADNVETTACDGEHSQHDAEGQDCLQRDEVSLEDGSGDGLSVPPMERACWPDGFVTGCDGQMQPKRYQNLWYSPDKTITHIIAQGRDGSN